MPSSERASEHRPSVTPHSRASSSVLSIFLSLSQCERRKRTKEGTRAEAYYYVSSVANKDEEEEECLSDSGRIDSSSLPPLPSLPLLQFPHITPVPLISNESGVRRQALSADPLLIPLMRGKGQDTRLQSRESVRLFHALK